MKTAYASRSMRRSSARGFTLIELLIVIAIIGILVALLLPAIAKAKCVANNGVCKATIEDLSRAMQSYEADFGIFPCKTSSGLINDTKQFVALLQVKGPRFARYYNFKDDDLIGGAGSQEYMSPFDRPYHYTFPAFDTNAGPDGKKHQGLSYLLWTWGCVNDPPDNDYENNNWAK